jgi:putative protease
MAINATMEQQPPAAEEPRRAWPHPELLAPAGDWECARAAVENGADAIYFGLERFNARMRADNFTAADLPRLMDFLHRRGVKGYVTFNTLVFADEMADAEQYLRTLISAGVDAAIVQDIGICRLIRQLSPDFPIHASTQMTITSAAGVEFARALGCNLVVLARECSIRVIGQMAQPATLPLEVFVHGALCVAYSGQCLTSEALGGRSANRGECAQACRMPYELISDGQLVPLGDRRYLLSPQDLAGLEVLPDLVRAGVSSLKIEGRLKSPEYVANITRVYRRALDSSFAPPDAQTRYNLEMAFSRGLHTGWLGGINNQLLVHARFGKPGAFFCICKRRSNSVTASSSTPANRTRKRKADAWPNCGPHRRARPKRKSGFSARSISAAFIRATKFGRRAIRSWTARCAKVFPARRRIFSGRLIWKFKGGPANRWRSSGAMKRAAWWKSGRPCRWPWRKTSR